MSDVIRPAREADLPTILRLITDEGMPTFEAGRFLDTFWVAESGSDVVGCVALEVYGDAALLRSVVAAPAQRGAGLGGRLCRYAIEEARARGIRTLCLFTMTAAPFFASLGFQPCRVEEFPPALGASTQVSSLARQPQLAEFLTAMQMHL